VQARDCGEQDPAARTRDTPQDAGLRAHLRTELVEGDLERVLSFGTKVGRTLGAGLYAHDLLVEADAGELYLCESEFKFYPKPYMRRFKGLLDDEQELFSTCCPGRICAACGGPIRRILQVAGAMRLTRLHVSGRHGPPAVVSRGHFACATGRFAVD